MRHTHFERREHFQRQGSRILVLALALFAPAWATADEQSDVGETPPIHIPGLQRGTSTTFIKRLEIMGADAFGRNTPRLTPRTAVFNLKRYDAIWAGILVARNNRQAWTLLRTQHPDILALYYMSSETTRPNDYGWYDYQYIENVHPEWFLIRDARPESRQSPLDPNNRIRWSNLRSSGSNYNRYWVDVANPEFQDWAIELLMKRVSGSEQHVTHPYSGLALDNVSIDSDHMKRITQRNPHWTYAGRLDDWNRGFCQYLRKVRAALHERDMVLAINHSLDYGSTRNDAYWDELYTCADLIMTENALRSAKTITYTDKEWELSLEHHDRIIAHDLVDWWVCYPDDHAKFLYEYCSWLLIKKPGHSLFYASRGSMKWRYPVPAWYEEYDLDLGPAQEPREKRAGLWWRRYANGLVVVNPGKQSVTADLPPDTRWRNTADAQLLDELTLAPAEAAILQPMIK